MSEVMETAMRAGPSGPLRVSPGHLAVPLQKTTTGRIIAAFTELTGIRIEDLASPSQAPTISLHRHRLMYLIRRIDPVASYQGIGRYLGGRDMSTIHEAVAKVTRLADQVPAEKAELRRLEGLIRETLAAEDRAVPKPRPWQLLAACSALTDDKLTDAEARRVALRFLVELEATYG